MSAVSIICLGPTGVGYFCDVADLPTQDRGVVASRHGALLVCDAAIVSSICAPRFPGRVHLVTNNLGSVAAESQLLREKLESGVTIYPDPLMFMGAPIDMVMVDRGRGTRSFVTTNYYPSNSHILTTTRAILASLPQNSRVVSYVDVEVSSDSGRAALDASPILAPSDGSVWNVGQVAQLSDAQEWLTGAALPENAIIQVSLGNSNMTHSEIRSAWRLMTSAPSQKLVVSLGSAGAAWADGRNTEVIGVVPVTDAFTLGAGAVLAGCLVMGLARSESPHIGGLVADAVEAATRYVRDATVHGDMQGLALW